MFSFQRLLTANCLTHSHHTADSCLLFWPAARARRLQRCCDTHFSGMLTRSVTDTDSSWHMYAQVTAHPWGKVRTSNRAIFWAEANYWLATCQSTDLQLVSTTHCNTLQHTRTDWLKPRCNKLQNTDRSQAAARFNIPVFIHKLSGTHGGTHINLFCTRFGIILRVAYIVYIVYEATWIYTYIHIYIHIHMYTYVYTYMYLYVCLYIYIYAYICI